MRFLPPASGLFAIACYASTADVRAAELSDKLPLLDRLPVETSAYVFRSGSDRLSEKLAGTPAGDVIADEEVSGFLHGLEHIYDKTDDVAVRTRWRTFVHSIHADMVCAHIPGEDDQVDVLCVAVPSSEQARKEMEESVRELMSKSRNAKGASNANVGDDVPGGRLFSGAVADEKIGWIGDRFVLIRGTKAREVMLGPRPSKSLLDSPRFQHAIHELVMPNPVGFYYYDLTRVWPSFGDENDRPRVEASGLTSLEAVAGATNIADGRYRNEHFWSVDKRRGGLFKHVQNNPIPPGWLNMIPADAVSFTYGTWDPHDFLMLFAEQTQDAQAAPATSQTAEDGSDIATLFGCGIPSRLVESLGTRYLVYRKPTPGMGINPLHAMIPPFAILPAHQMLFSLELRDDETCRNSLDEIWRTASKSRKQSIFLFDISTPNLRKMRYRDATIYEMEYYVSGYFSIQDGRLLFSMNPQLLKDAIAHPAKAGQSLADTPGFKAVHDQVPKNACFLAYMHKAACFEEIYSNWAGLSQQYGAFVLLSLDPVPDFSFADLPSAKSISRHLKRSAYLYGIPGNDGVVFKGEADLLPLSWWLAQLQMTHDLMQLEAACGKSD